jgi:iron complex outermembrane receptor protein
VLDDALPSAVQAQSDEEELALAYGDQRSISIATGASQPLQRAPAAATVITAEAIAAMGATDLDEVLETVAGLHVARSANFYGPLYVIRGIYSQFHAAGAGPAERDADDDDVRRQQGQRLGRLSARAHRAHRGDPRPGSALYGADAYSGVINIITKSAADIAGTQLGLRLGSFDTRDAWVQHGGRLGPLDVAAYLHLGRSDGHRAIIARDAAQPAASLAPGPVNLDRRSVDANLELGYRRWRGRLNYKLRDKVGTGAGVASALDPSGKDAASASPASLRGPSRSSDPTWAPAPAPACSITPTR